jgi:hypothetical protein
MSPTRTLVSRVAKIAISVLCSRVWNARPPLSMNWRLQLGYHVGTWEVPKPDSEPVKIPLRRAASGHSNDYCAAWFRTAAAIAMLYR